ncbi:MAG TPA: hypothetical protein VG013_23765 [Gemmataceae bacterium]|jgi:hypothetical protein|nr:hypothetical protein [Gemmataceae bacterium]
MLSDRVCQLLTAYVDGELSPRQRQVIERLLARSAEARAMLQQLQEGAGILRGLPRRALGRDLAGPVLRTIAERRLHPARRAALAASPAVPAWTGLAAAAAVLLVVAVGSYFYFAATLPANRPAPSANANQDRHAKQPEKQPAAPQPQVVQSSTDNTPVNPPRPQRPGKIDTPAVVKKPEPGPSGHKPKPPISEPPDDAMLTDLASPRDPDPKLEVFDKVNLGIALSLPVRTLDHPAAKRRLREKLREDSAYRLELSCLGHGKAFERLQVGLQARGLRLLIDQLARTRLKNPRLKTDYVVYCESLTAVDLAAVLEQLGGEDKKAEAKRHGDGQFDSVVVNQLTKTDHAKLCSLLGVDPILLQPPRRKTPLGVDIRKPLSDATADQVAQAAAGQGVPRPEPGKPSAKGAQDRLAVVLACNPVRRKPASSREVKMFLDSRKERRPGTVQVLFILRGANG